ncbi:thyrotropin subunit beta-like [Genypterus blacodes]|uniref:thyrotropin subunit beta-like n=1 Tax=Genypterus blacodes TaxID=154954 RepID=UPI003F776658
MDPSVFACGLLVLLFSPVAPLCIPTDFTLYVEKPECDYCVAINTTICMGFCFSKDINMNININRRRNLIQTGCAYDKVEYRTAILPGCSFVADPVFTYPVALSCHCSACSTDGNECAHRASRKGATCTKPVRRIYPYPEKASYLLPF